MEWQLADQAGAHDTIREGQGASCQLSSARGAQARPPGPLAARAVQAALWRSMSGATGSSTAAAALPLGTASRLGPRLAPLRWPATLAREDEITYVVQFTVLPPNCVQVGAKVVSASFGGTSFSMLELNAINALGLNDSILVAAAGNDATNIDAAPL